MMYEKENFQIRKRHAEDKDSNVQRVLVTVEIIIFMQHLYF